MQCSFFAVGDIDIPPGCSALINGTNIELNNSKHRRDQRIGIIISLVKIQSRVSALSKVR